MNSGDTIVIAPVGSIPPDIYNPVLTHVEAVFGYRTRLDTIIETIEFAYDEGRQQYHSTKILERLAALCPDHGLKVLAVTREDLFIPILTHVYGEAQLGGRSAIVSFSRLREGIPAAGLDDIFLNRVIKEAVHELGHTFKLLHCKDRNCIMHYCRSITDVDRKADQLCRYCKILLEDERKRLQAGRL